MRSVVEKEYRRSEYVQIYRHDHNYFESIKKDVQKSFVIFGHMTYGFHSIFNVKGQYVTFIRNPIDRVISFYNHQLLYKDSTYNMLVAQGKTLKEMLLSERYHQLNNHMTRIISGHHGTEQVSDSTVLDKALERVEKKFLFIGITERMDESLNKLGHLLSWKKRKKVPRLNVTPLKKPLKISKKTITTIKKYNQLDIQLYNHISDIFTSG